MSIHAQVKAAIETAIPGSTAVVSGAGGHYEIEVVSAAFAGKRILEKQRMVYSAITPFMAGDAAPVHAIDRLVCNAP